MLLGEGGLAKRVGGVGRLWRLVRVAGVTRLTRTPGVSDRTLHGGQMELLTSVAEATFTAADTQGDIKCIGDEGGPEVGSGRGHVCHHPLRPAFLERLANEICVAAAACQAVGFFCRHAGEEARGRIGIHADCTQLGPFRILLTHTHYWRSHHEHGQSPSAST